MDVSTIFTLISLSETRMETSQEILASFYETRFLESEIRGGRKPAIISKLQIDGRKPPTGWKANLSTLLGQEEGQTAEQNLVRNQEINLLSASHWTEGKG